MILRNLILVVGLFYCESLVADCFRDGRKAIEYRDFDAAIEHFTACIDQRHLPEGKRVSSFIYRGISYHEQGRDTLAIQDYTSAIKLNRDYAVAYNNRGIAYKSQGKLDLAIQDYTKAIRLDPSSAKAYNYRGNYYQESGEEDLAIQDYSRAIKRDKKYVDAYMNRGWIYLSQGRNDLAIQDYNRVIDLDPQYAAAHFHRGMGYEGKGQIETARRDYGRAGELDPTDDRFREALARVTSTTGQPAPTTRQSSATARQDGPTARQTTPTARQSTPTARQSTPTARQSTPTARQSTPTTQRPRRSVAARDTIPPQINVQRDESVISRSRHTVIGQATDASGVGIVEVNGKEAQLDEHGNFSASIILKPGSNNVEIVAYDIYDNQASKVISIRREVGRVAAAQPVIKAVRTGDYHALLLAVEDYQHPDMHDLSHPIKDASMVSSVLQEQYTFERENITLLKNPDQRQIVGALNRLSKQVSESDSVLIFYAGHGDWDEQFGQGYWLPSDADPDSKVAWIYNSTVRDYINGIKSKNTLLVSDACFIGGAFDVTSLTKEATTQELYDVPTRKAMTSGTLSGVPDTPSSSSAAPRSIFTEYLVKRLETNPDKYLSSETLFARLSNAVTTNSSMDQTPQIGRIREAGDEGGDFIFVRR